MTRVYRQYQNLIQRCKAGYYGLCQEEPGPGSLALSCPACPMPEVNLPEGWDMEAEASVLFYIFCLTILT